jgi:bacteriorhodopsin
MKNIRLFGILFTVAALLLVPFVAMQLGAEGVKWTVIDFIAAAIMLVGAGLAIEVALRVVKRWQYRVAACVAILFVLAVVWVELAVGIIGTPFAGS